MKRRLPRKSVPSRDVSVWSCNSAADGAIRPLLRWAGGKQRLLPHLLRACPADVHKRDYYEPFLGAASLFLTLRPIRAVLCDANPALIAFYRHIRANPSEVASILSRMTQSYSESHYYSVRAAYNTGQDTAAQAARFLYLNRTCFNGIFRVSRTGVFNVPFGHKANPIFPSADELKQVAEALTPTDLRADDFSQALERVGPGAFVYLDPPYPPLNGTSNFSHYTMDRFSEDDQLRLADTVRCLDAMGARFLMSNADIPRIRTYYAGFRFREIPVVRYVTCKRRKHTVREVLISNY